MLYSGSKKSKFIKKQEAKGLLSNIGIRTPFSKIPLLDDIRGGYTAAATSKMECFVIIVHGWKPLTIITKHSILDAAAVLDPPLDILF